MNTQTAKRNALREQQITELAPLRFDDPARRDPAMVAWVGLALLMIAVNAVVIQTILTDDSPVKNYIRVGVLAITVFMVAVRRVLLPGWLITLVIVTALLYLMTANTDQLTILFVLLMAPALWSVPERSLEKSAMIASLVALILVFVFLWLGWTTNELRVSQTYLSAEIRQRYTFGTNGVPFFMNIVYGAVVFTIFYMYRWRIRGRAFVAVVALIGVGYVYTQTDARGGVIAVAAFCVLAAVLPKIGRWRIVGFFLSAQPVIYAAFTLWLASQRDNPQANLLFSFRPQLYGQFLDGVSIEDLLTSTTVKAAEGVSTVDSSMLHLLYGGGVVFFVVFCVLFARAVSALIARGLFLHLAFLSSAMAYGVSESILLRVENVFILFAWYIVLRFALRRPDGALLPAKR